MAIATFSGSSTVGTPQVSGTSGGGCWFTWIFGVQIFNKTRNG